MPRPKPKPVRRRRRQRRIRRRVRQRRRIPIATMTSPIATMTISPWRSAKCPERMIHDPLPDLTVAYTNSAMPVIQATTRASPARKPPTTITAIARRFGHAYRTADRNSSPSAGRPETSMAMAVRKITASGTANRTPPPPLPNAVPTAAAIGTLAAVATRNRTRTERWLPGTAFADHVNCDHGKPQQQEQQGGLADAVPRRVVEQECDELREGEHVGEVEEQLDRISSEVLGALRQFEATHGLRVARPSACRGRVHRLRVHLGAAWG